jgi:hypothetical protein
MFRSFFMAGYECATGYNIQSQWIDQIAATQHDRFVREDYRLLRQAGIQTIREGVRWPLIDKAGQYDFSSLTPFVDACEEAGIQPIWDLFHYGYPDDVDLLSEEFSNRFADYCFAVSSYICQRSSETQFFTPINEPSYFSWAAGHAAKFAPYLTDRGYELKVALARAAIRGIEAIWKACPTARIVNVDPICHVAPPLDRPDMQGDADFFNSVAVMECWDMICGRLLPELGGSREHLDIVGLNYYWTNQWEVGAPEIPLADDDPRRWPLSKLVKFAYERYGGDILITETSHVGDMRPIWMRELTRELEIVLAEKVPLKGVCLYPVLGMPEWHEQSEWTCMGLWDLERNGDVLERVPCESALRELQLAQKRLEQPARRRARMA